MTVSSGPKQVGVPDLTRSGSRRPRRQNLEQAGLKAGTIRRDVVDDQPAGTVISNDPPGGTQAPEGSAVNLLLSSGSAKVSMPEVYGETADDAAQKIQDAGLVPRTPSSFPTNDPALDGTVQEDLAAAGHARSARGRP